MTRARFPLPPATAALAEASRRPAAWSMAVAALLLTAPVPAGLTQTVAAPGRRPPSWADIDNLRSLLTAHGTKVLQQDCNQRGLQGLYHDRSDTIVICRVHRDPQAVWNTLAHEATHRMQACAGGSITDPGHHQAMARALASYEPQEWRSIAIYPREQQLSELEARYTARLPPEQVPRLFRRYCNGSGPSTLSRQP
ncbi:MAG: hypothetical protein NTW51_14980 [Cyanobacteria bacterium]|nr:hypothetical protein [Cyanobacteriota bacterium]